MRNTEVTIFKRLLNTKGTPYNYSLESIFEKIKNGNVKEDIELIRESKTKKEYDKRKKGLACICFAGTFKFRAIKGLDTHVGLSIIDFDKYPTEEVYKEQFELHKKNPHYLALFRSPGGKGIKGVIRIPESNSEEHTKYFKAFQKKFNYEYFDNQNSNVDRVCFVSYDPDIYINWDAEVFEPTLIDEGHSVHERVPLIPINDEMTIIDKIMAFDWKKDFNDGERNAFILDIAGAFCEYGVSQTTTEGYILNNVIHGDFTEAETIRTIKSAYKIRSFNSKYFENYQKIERIKLDLKKGKKIVLKDHKIDEDVYTKIKEISEEDDFWTINNKGKISIIPIRYKFFLESNGFKKHFANEAEKPTFVKIESNKVEITSTAKIKDFVLDYLINRKEIDVWNYVANYNNLFSEQFLLMLDSIDLLMLSDTKDISYISFNNGILEVSKEEIKLVDYIDVDGYVWKSQIIDRIWSLKESYENDYKTFINNISNNDPDAMESTLGYMLYGYKNRSNNKAIILNDEVISDNPEGGTGKGLLIQGLTHMRKTSIIDGKQFDSKKSFAYQTVSLDTKILVFDDVKKNFDFEEKFSLITEGITLERKNKDAIKLNVHDSPKLMLSTNYAIRGSGNSHDRRRHELEISQYYGKDKTPEDEFKKELFDEWDDDEFQSFDNYMVRCLQLFMRVGLMHQNAKNIKLRRFIAESSMEFYEWADDVENLALNIRHDKDQYFEKFTNEYKDFGKWLHRKTFLIWVKKYAKFKGLDYKDGHSNALRWFEISNGEAPGNDNNDEVPF